MKKSIFILLLILLMAGSLLSGTLAMYTTRIDNLASGSVAAKEFVFTGEGTESFGQGIKIAPSETVTWPFSVKNYEGQTVTETDLYYKLTFHVTAASGRSAIEPLVVNVKDENGNVLNGVTGVGSFDVTGTFPLSMTGQEHTYTVEITWPDDGADDIDYAGGGYGSAITVDAVASQSPFGGDDGGNGGNEEQRDISVAYQTTAAWSNGQSGNYQFNYQVTITNNSDEPIEDWYITFSLPTDTLKNAWSNAKLVHSSGGTYTFEDPGYNNGSTDSIQPGQSVSFGGNASGMGTEAISGVTVGGSNTGAISVSQPACAFGSIS